MSRRNKTLAELEEKYGKELMDVWYTASSQKLVIPCPSLDPRASRTLAMRLRFILYEIRAYLRESTDPATRALYEAVATVRLCLLVDANEKHYLSVERGGSGNLNDLIRNAGISEALARARSAPESETETESEELGRKDALPEPPDLTEAIFNPKETKNAT